MATLVFSACSGTDSTDPLASGASFNHHNPPSQPTSLATPEPVVTVSGSTVTVSWGAVAGADEYQVVSTAAGIHTPQTSATSVTATVANGSYTVKVRARTTSSNNESGFSKDETFTVAAVIEAENPGDNTPPVIEGPFIVGTLGTNGWYTSDVTVTWTATDAESAVTLNGCSVSVTSDTPGSSYTCTATSEGGSATSSVTIKRDATIPAISFAGNAGSYLVDQSVSITCSASDAMSGVATSNCVSVSGDAYRFNIGTNAISASATDNAGNGNGASASFTVSVTSGSLCNLTRRFVAHHGIANSLCVKLNAAAAADARGNMTAKAGALNAYVQEVKAQTGKHISAANAAILVSLAGQL